MFSTTGISALQLSGKLVAKFPAPTAPALMNAGGVRYSHPILNIMLTCSACGWTSECVSRKYFKDWEDSESGSEDVEEIADDTINGI